jgi:type II secretory pathway pseudopilin PulG
LRGEDGYSLVELLVAISLLVLVLGLLMSPMIFSAKTQTRDANYAFAQQQAQSGLESMVSQIRQATAILSSGSDSVTMNVTLGGTAYVVEYDCSAVQPRPAGSTLPAGTTECLRYSALQGNALPATYSVVVTNLLNQTSTPQTPVFSWGPDLNAPYYMTATIDVPSGNGAYGGLNHGIVFSDGALMRNLNVGN